MKQKKWRKLVSALVAAVMLLSCLSGCEKEQQAAGDENTNGQQAGSAASGQENAGGKGRFLESEIALPEGVSAVYDIKALGDGTLAVIALNSKEASFCRYTSGDMGETWDTQNFEMLDYVVSARILEDGSLVALLEDTDPHAFYLYKLQPDGTEEKIDVTFPELVEIEEEMLVISGGAVTENGKLLVRDIKNAAIYQIDIASGEAVRFTDNMEAGTYFQLAGKRIHVVSKNGIVLRDTDTGEVLEEDSVLSNVIKEDRDLAVGNTTDTAPLVFGEGLKEDEVVYATHAGIFYHKYDGSVSEQLLNGALNSINNPAMGFAKIEMVDAEHILLLVWEAEKWKLFSYTYDSNVSAMPETELKVYALEDSALLRQAIVACQKNYPDIYVNLQIGLSGEDGVTVEDALRSLNTEILAGNGPDALLLDGMPVDSYIEKGILADISPLLEELDNADGLFENVYHAYQKNGAIYEFPARFYMSIVSGDKEAVAAGENLIDFANYGVKKKKEGAKFVFSYKSPTELLERLYELEASEWINKNGKLDAEKINDWLTIARQIYEVDLYGEAPEITNMGAYGLQPDVAGEVSAFNMLTGECEVEFGSIRSMDEMISLHSALDSLGEEYGYDIVSRDTAKVFTPYGLVGIVNSTNRRMAAEQFVKTFLGTECGSVDGGGFPVNKTAYETLCDAVQHKYSSTYMGCIAVFTDEGVSFEMEFRNLTASEVERLTKHLESLTEPAPQDTVMRDIVVEQAENYLMKNQTKEETVNAILQKCNLYLSE